MQVMTEDAGSNLTRVFPAVGGRHRRIRVGAVIALALVIGFVAWLVLRDRGSSTSTSPIPKDSKALPVSLKGLHALASLGIQIYWIGQRQSAYELTKTADNRVFIRYLPGGAKVGSKKQFLTIGTYPVKDAFATTRRLAGLSSSVKVATGKGGVAYYRSDAPTNVFLAYPGVKYRIEVYDPSPGRARDLVASSQVVAVR